MSQAGVEERSFFGSRQIPWEAIGALEYQDVRKKIEDFNNLVRRRWEPRKFSTIPRIDVWMIKDRQERDVLTLPAGMTPSRDFLALRERIQLRTSTR